MDHDHMNHTSSFTFDFPSEMQMMWILMAVMFAWNLHMVIQHHKLKKKVECHCGAHPCVKCEGEK
jgi:hypothetical protein